MKSTENVTPNVDGQGARKRACSSVDVYYGNLELTLKRRRG